MRSHPHLHFIVPGVAIGNHRIKEVECYGDGTGSVTSLWGHAQAFEGSADMVGEVGDRDAEHGLRADRRSATIADQTSHEPSRLWWRSGVFGIRSRGRVIGTFDG